MSEFTPLLQQLSKETHLSWKSWTAEERHTALKLYYLISKHEASFYDLVYSYHGCDSWEDLFRDYDREELKDKMRGVQIALKYFDKTVVVDGDSEEESEEDQ